MLKAYSVHDKDFYNPYTTVVFAEKPSEAKALALRTDAFEDYSYTDIRVRRVPELDSEFRGRWEMDWYDKEDRIALVKKLGMYCDYDARAMGECDECPAKDICTEYKNLE